MKVCLTSDCNETGMEVGKLTAIDAIVLAVVAWLFQNVDHVV